MAKLLRKLGAASQIFQVFIQDSSSTTGAGLTGLTSGSSGLVAYYHRDTDTTATAISLVTMTVGSFTTSGFKEIDSTNMPGFYQLCPPNACFSSGAASVAIMAKGATNMAPLVLEVDLDPQVDLCNILGTAVSTPATAGILDINVKNMNNVAATSITTINANQGTTQPINFTSTAGSALVKSDMIDIASAAVSTSTAQIGVNAVNIGGTAQTGRDLGASVLLSSGTGTGQLSLSSGTVTVGTNNDKTGYSLTQSFPSNFSSMSINSAGRVEIQSGLTTDVALNSFEWPMISSTDHVTPVTGASVTVQRSINGGAFANCTNTPATEVSNGVYKINLSAADLNGTTITLLMTASGCDNRYVTFVTTP